MKKKSRRIGCFFSSNLIGQHIQSQTSLDLTKEKRHLELENELFFKQQDMYPKKKRIHPPDLFGYFNHLLFVYKI